MPNNTIKSVKKWSDGLGWSLTLLVALILPAHGLLGLAQESSTLAVSDQATIESTNSADQGSAVNLENLSTDQKNLLVKTDKSNKFLDRIKLEITTSERELLNVSRNVNITQQKLDESKDKVSSLQEQLDQLDEKINNSKIFIENVENQIEKKKSDIDSLKYELEQEKVAISFQKKMLLEYLNVIFKDREKFNSLNEQGQELNTLKLLLSDQSSADNLRSLRYSEILEAGGREIFEKLDQLIEEQQVNEKLMSLKQRTLTIMYSRLNDEKFDLENEVAAKTNLLEQTKGVESSYQQLLEKNKAEQEDVLLQIDTLRKNMSFVQDKMKALGDKFNPDDYAHLLNIYNSKDLKSYLEGSNDSNAEFNPNWPVNPLRGLSAYFMDSSYERFFHMAHHAIDVPTPQGTPIHAPADGFVYKTADNGYGYSYIILAHTNGYMTLYGHVSDIMVRTGDEIRSGDVIGLSGATPGTKGAGVYTTGAHLHFEVIKNGVNVDPLDYLNLAYLRLDSLPEKYVAKALGDQKKVKRNADKVKVKRQQKDINQIMANTGLVDPNAGFIDPNGELFSRLLGQ